MWVWSAGEVPPIPPPPPSPCSGAPSAGLVAVGGSTAPSSLPRSRRATSLALCVTNRTGTPVPPPSLMERQTRSEPVRRDTQVTVTSRHGAEQKQTSTRLPRRPLSVPPQQPQLCAHEHSRCGEGGIRGFWSQGGDRPHSWTRDGPETLRKGGEM